MTKNKTAGLALALATACISGVAIYLNGKGVRAFHGSDVYTTGKNAVAAVLLLALTTVPVRGRRLLTRPEGRRVWWSLVAIAVVGGSVPFALFFEGLSKASSVQASFLQKTLVVWVALLAVPLLRERFGVAQGAAIAVLVVGQAALTGQATGPLHLRWDSGAWLILAATLLWAVEVVLIKALLPEVSSWTVGVARMAGGSVLLLAWLATRGRLDDLARLTGKQVGWLALTGTLLAAYVATWFAALARARAVDVTAILVFGAVVTNTLSVVLDGVRPAPQLWGLLLVLAGTSVVALGMRRRPAPQLLAAGP